MRPASFFSMKKNYVIPDAENVENILAFEILQATGAGEIEGYSEGQDFVW